MSHYEYKAIPAPTQGEATSAAQTDAARISQAVETRLNAMASEGWTYVRADAFPVAGASELSAVMIFRREDEFGVFSSDKPKYGTFDAS